MGKRGPKPTKPDWSQVEKLAALHCTGEEIAEFLGISYDTLERACKREMQMKLADYLAQKKSIGRTSLRRAQYTKAVNEGNTTMLIWLGKQWLGQTDKIEHSGDDEKPIKLAYDPNRPLLNKPKIKELKSND